LHNGDASTQDGRIYDSCVPVARRETCFGERFSTKSLKCTAPRGDITHYCHVVVVVVAVEDDAHDDYDDNDDGFW
jgi:hypothetical protein